MNKQKFHYNPETLRYEPARSKKSTKFLKGLAYASSVFILASILTWGMFTIIDSPKEKVLKRDLEKLRNEFNQVQNRILLSDQVLADIAERDDDIYRVIFEAEPISNEIRSAGIGGSNRYAYLENLRYGEVVKKTKSSLDQLERRIAIQSKSYDELKLLIEEKEEMLSSIPAIQPIAKKKGQSLVSGYGKRYHPIYKTRKMHTGLDFTALIGTDIYATGNGVVKIVEKKRTGYGYHVVIDHGFGYETLYGHMSKIDVSKGQKIKRGEIIGKVGNTGTSTAPHVHYEVIRNGNKINPIHFFFNDLTPEEYEDIIEKAEQSNQSFD